MKITLLLVLLVVIWRWTCASSPPRCSEDLETNSGHRCQHTEPINDFEDPQRTKRNVITSLTGTVKNATKYIGRKLHIIRKRETGETKIPTHGEHLKLENRTEDGKRVSSKLKRNVTISDDKSKNKTQTVPKVGVNNETNSVQTSKPIENLEERIKRNISEQGNKTHKIHRRREISIAKNDSSDDANCTRPRKYVASSKLDIEKPAKFNKTNPNNQRLARESRELDETSAKGTNSSNKISRQVQNTANVSKGVYKAPKTTRKPRVPKDASDLTESRKNFKNITIEDSLENIINISKLENTTASREGIDLTNIKRAISHSNNTLEKSNQTNAALARATRDVSGKNVTKACNSTDSNAQTHARTTRDVLKSQNGTVNGTELKREVSQQNNETTKGSKRVNRDVAKSGNATKLLSQSQTNKRLIRETSEIKNATTKLDKTGNNARRDVSKSKNVTTKTENYENPKNVSRVARDADKTNKTAHNATRVNRNVSESAIAKENNKNAQNLTRVTGDVSDSKNVTGHDSNSTRATRNTSNATEASRSSPNVEEKSDNAHHTTKVNRGISKIAPKDNGTIQNFTRTTRDVSQSNNSAQHSNEEGHTTHNITKAKREDFEPDDTTTKSENSKNTKNIGRPIRDVAKSDNVTKKPDEALARVTRNASKSENDTKKSPGNDEKTYHNLTRVIRGAPKANNDSNEDHQDTHNITKLDAKNVKREAQDFPKPSNITATKLNIHDETRVARDVSGPNNTTPKLVNKNTENIHNITRAKRDKSEKNNSSKNVRTTKSNNTNNTTSEKGKRNVSEIKNTTKFDKDGHDSQNITMASTSNNSTRNNKSKTNIMRVPKNHTVAHIITKAKRDIPKDVQNITRTKRDSSEPKNTTKHSHKTSHSNSNITRTERDGSKPINETVKARNSDVSDAKNSTKRQLKRVRRDLSKSKISYENTQNTDNSTKTERGGSKLNNATKCEKTTNSTKNKRRIPREIPKQRNVARNSEVNVNQNKTTTKIDKTTLSKRNSTSEVDEMPDEQVNKTVNSEQFNKSRSRPIDAMEKSESADETFKSDTESSVNEQDNNFEVRSSKHIGNESKENSEGNSKISVDDSAERSEDSLVSSNESDKVVDTKNNNEAYNNRLRRNQRKSNSTNVKHHYDRNDTRLPRFTKTTKTNASNAVNDRKERVEIDSALKIAVPIDGNPVGTKAVLSKTKRSGDDDGTDIEYILIHDVPPCRRKKRSEEYDQPEQFESKLTGNRKNITIIIQNLVATMRKKRETSDLSTITNNTEQAQNDNATGDGRVSRGNVKVSNVKSPKAKNDTKTNKHNHRSKREADEAFSPEKDMKCCPPQNGHIGSLGNEILNSQREKIWKPITRNSEIPNPIGVPSGNNSSKVDQKSKQDKTVVEKEAVVATRSKKFGRSLLSVLENGNENDIDLADSVGIGGSFMGFSGSTKSSLNILHKNMVDANPHFFVGGGEMRMPVEKTSIKPVDKVKCACAIFFDDPDSNEKNPLVIENFLDYPEGATAGDREIICSRTCSESSKLYYKMRQVVLCTHVKNFHHHLQTIMPIEHTPEEDDESETIFCQVVPGEAEPPLRYIVSWLNIILLDVVVCLTGLGIVCVYLICFVTWKKRDAIPIYTSASFTVK